MDNNRGFKKFIFENYKRNFYLSLSYTFSILLTALGVILVQETNFFSDSNWNTFIAQLIFLVLSFAGFASFIDTIIFQVKTWDRQGDYDYTQSGIRGNVNNIIPIIFLIVAAYILGRMIFG